MWTDTLKHLAGTFVELTDAVPAKSEPVSSEPTAAATAMRMTAPTAAPVPVPSLSNPIADSTMLDKLRKKLEAVDTPFSKFTLLEESLTTELPNEQTRWRVAFKAQKISYEDLIVSFQTLGQAIDRETTAFEGSLEQRRAQEIAAREHSVQSIGESIASKQQEMAQIQQEIIGLQQQQAQISGEISAERGKLDALETSFKNAVLAARSEVAQNAGKAQSYLGGTK
jgi:chromosome segregation ATPase